MQYMNSSSGGAPGRSSAGLWVKAMYCSFKRTFSPDKIFQEVVWFNGPRVMTCDAGLYNPNPDGWGRIRLPKL
jgi:hypothetical protein